MARYNTDGSSALAPNDPYNNMDRAETRPNFQVRQGGNTGPAQKGNRDNFKVVDGGKSSSSKDLLRNSENSALSKNEPTFNSPWKNSVSGQKNSNNKNAKGKIGSKKKGGIAAMMVIITLLVGGGTFLGSSHSLLAPAMESLMTEATDTQHASWALRTTKLFNYANNHSGTSSSNFTKSYADIPTDAAQVKAKQGRVATFFDKMATKIYNKLGLSRNVFNDYKQTGNADADMDNFRNTMNSEYDNNSSTIRGAYDKEVQETDENGRPLFNDDGSPKMTTDPVNETDLDGRSNSNIADADQKAQDFVNSTTSKVANIAGTVGNIGNITCAMMRVGATISAVVAANEIYQSINYFMNYMENISKMKYGEGENSAINEVLNTLTTPVNTTYSNINDFDDEGNGGEDIDFSGAPVQANGLQMMLAYAPASIKTTDNFSLERTGNAIANFLNMNAAQVMTCAGVQAGAAVVSIATTIGTLGVSAIGQMVFNFATSVAISATTSVALSFIVPTIAKTLFTNIFETTTGIPAGELLARGASAANTRVGRSGSGQSLASGDVALAYSRITQDVIAMEAEADRQNRSPFDITSKNTFLGSIVYNLLPITLLSPKSSTSLLTNVNTFARATSSALSSLTNSTFATGNSIYMASFGKCPNLESIGAVGDIYCNPITITDPSLIDMDPEDSEYIRIISRNLEHDSNGNYVIKTDSDLAKYITYCDGRDSPFGTVDTNILGNLEKGNVILNSIPIIGDVIDLVNSSHTAENLAWSSGQACVNSSTNNFWKDDYRYYQRYIEDQRILEWAGAYGDSQSPVMAYETQYEKEHPLDNSPAGYLARISGITKDDAETIIAFAEYYNYIANYDPETRTTTDDYNIATTGNEIVANLKNEHPSYGFSSDKNATSPIIAINNHYVLYDDVRNRSYAA